jgi:hypothetical protein
VQKETPAESAGEKRHAGNTTTISDDSKNGKPYIVLNIDTIIPI